MVSDSDLRKELQAAERRLRELELRLQGSLGAAQTDDLTGLWNSRYLEEQLPKELARVKGGALPLSLMLLDVDGLQSFNERSGTAAAQAVLKEVATVLRGSARGVDTVGRWREDAFLVLMPEASKAEALALAKRVCSHLHPYFKSAGGGIAIAGSVGIAAHPVDGEEVGELVQRAQAALQMAKGRGDNQICVYAGAVGGRRKRLGEYLMELGVCTAEQMEQALRYCLEATQRGEFLAVGEALAKLGHATEEEVDRALKIQAQERAGGP